MHADKIARILSLCAVAADISCWGFAVVPAIVSQCSNGRRSRIRPTLLALSTIKPLATEGDWTAYLDDEGTGFVYYFNGVTGESLWEKPTDTFPDVTLDGSLKQTAIEKQGAYLKSVEEEKANKKGFFQAILDTPAEVVEAKPKQPKEKKEDNDWFGSIFERAEVQTMQQKKEKNVDSDWFAPFLESVSNQKPKEKEQGIFGGIFSSSKVVTEDTTPRTTVTYVQEETSIAEPTKEDKTSKKEAITRDGGGFGGIFKNMVAETTSKPASQKETTKPAELPKKDEVKIEVKESVVAPIKIESAAYVLPHPAKVRWGGEDAVFVKGRTFGVFDGVSGAEKLDGVPLYSKTMADEMKKLVKDNEALSIPELTKRMLQCAEIADQIATGASTAVVASIGEDGYLRALNVGDSTCIIIRNGKMVAKTREISHYFECPYQLSVDSPDRPRDGTKLNIELMRGDLILMGSDGIFDNLSDDQVVEIAIKEKQLQTIAKRVSELSRKVSLDEKAATPYAKMAKRYGDPDYKDGLGGKVDDVSCIVVSYS